MSDEKLTILAEDMQAEMASLEKEHYAPLILNQLQPRRDKKLFWVGGFALVGAAVAALQFPKLVALVQAPAVTDGMALSTDLSSLPPSLMVMAAIPIVLAATVAVVLRD